MPHAPLARIQARCERVAQGNEVVAERQVARQNRARVVNPRNTLRAPARANPRQDEDEVQQELVHGEGANYDDEEMDEDQPCEIYFSKGWPELNLEILKRLSAICGLFIFIADSSGIPALVQPDTDPETVWRTWWPKE